MNLALMSAYGTLRAPEEHHVLMSLIRACETKTVHPTKTVSPLSPEIEACRESPKSRLHPSTVRSLSRSFG